MTFIQSRSHLRPNRFLFFIKIFSKKNLILLGTGRFRFISMSLYLLWIKLFILIKDPLLLRMENGQTVVVNVCVQ